MQQRQIVNHEKFKMQFLLCFVSLVNLCAQEPLQNRAWICNGLSCFCLGIQGPVEHGCTPREARGLWSCRAWRFSVHAMATKRGKGHQTSPARTEELKTQPTAPNRIICSVRKQNKWQSHAEHHAAAVWIFSGAQQLSESWMSYHWCHLQPGSLQGMQKKQNLLYASDSFLLKKPQLWINALILRVGY